VIDAGYDVASLSRDLDLMTILTFSYHGAWDEKTGHGAPAYYRPGDDNLFFNVNSSIQYWLDQGAPRDKMLLSFPLYGPEFELKNPDDNGLDAPTTDNYEEMKYFQICHQIQNGGWTVVRDPQGRMGPYAYKGGRWVSFDDDQSTLMKLKYLKDLGLRGAMVWALDMDDFSNRCSCESFHMTKIINRALHRLEEADPGCPLLGTKPETGKGWLRRCPNNAPFLPNDAFGYVPSDAFGYVPSDAFGYVPCS
ncbi:unnamed protein product, partial [Cyprideis torosa]